MMSGPELQPGDIWWAWLDAPEGREQGGRRPVIVVSGPTYLEVADTLAMVVPVTSTARGWRNHVPVRGAAEVGGYAMSEQSRTLSRTGLKSFAGRVTPECLREIRYWIRNFLEM